MKKPLSRIASDVKASTTMTIDAMFKKMKAEGVNVVGFGAGEPDFDTPDNIKAAGKLAIDGNQTRYTPAAGTEALRKAVSAQLERDYKLVYKPSQIVVSSGAKHNLFLALMALCNPGDEVILPAPYWVSYEEMIKMTGAVPVIIHADEAHGFKMTPEQFSAAVTPKTKALVLNSPSNPTGMVYHRDELEAIADICVNQGIYVVCDEIYDKLVYDGKEFVSFPTLSPEVKDLTVLINGVSKTFAMTGWRVGWACANEEIAEVMGNYQSHSTSAPSSISQAAAIEALNGQQETVKLMRTAFAERRDYFVGRVNRIDRISCIKPEGAFYIMMNIERLIGKTLYGAEITGAEAFARLLLEKGKVAVVPCEGFGAPAYTRWSYAVSMETIKEGLDRLEKFLAEG